MGRIEFGLEGHLEDGGVCLVVGQETYIIGPPRGGRRPILDEKPDPEALKRMKSVLSRLDKSTDTIQGGLDLLNLYVAVYEYPKVEISVVSYAG
jgi:hypothetical protein